MCPPSTKTAAKAPEASDQAAPDALQIGAIPDLKKAKGRSQTRTAPVSSSLNIASSGSGLSI